MNRYFWLLSDRKTVREISLEKWRKLRKIDFYSENISYFLIVTYNNALAVTKGKTHIWLPLKQLKEVLS